MWIGVDVIQIRRLDPQPLSRRIRQGEDFAASLQLVIVLQFGSAVCETPERLGRAWDAARLDAATAGSYIDLFSAERECGTNVRTIRLGSGVTLVLIGLALRPEPSHAAAPLQPSPPAALQQAVCRPTLTIDGQEKRTGTAFLIQTGDAKPRRVLVMAHHLFNMAGHRAMSWSEMPARALSATCRTLDDKQVWTAGAAFAIEGAHALGDPESLRDIAILPYSGNASGGEPPPLKLATTPPLTGETVWLLAQTADPDRSGDVFHRAHVVQDGGFLAFAYDDKTLKLRETSGAPIIDARGDVVGVNVGYITQKDALVGVADTLATIQTALLDLPPAP